ncbi:MAG: hypothetical protein RL735_1643 [Pseudomonadota bacterium]|jgi:hypothetical protein
MSWLRPDARERLSEATRFLPLTVFILVASCVLFDLLANRPMFWTSDEGFNSLLWRGLIAGPFILFALMAAAQKNKSEK